MIKRAATAILMTCALAVAVVGCSDDADRGELVVGSTGTPAMSVMSEVYAGALRNAGSSVSTTMETGDYRDLLDDMDAATVDLFPAFSGLLLDQLAPQLTPQTPDDVYRDLNRSLPQGVSVGDPTMVTATPEVFVAASIADRGNVTDLTDCDRLPAGSPLVVVGRPDQGVIEAFTAAGCRFGPVESVGSVSDAAARVATGRAVGILTPLDVAGGDAEGAIGDIRALRSASPATESTTPSTTSPATTTDVAAAVGPRPQTLVPVYRTGALSTDQVKTMNVVAGEMTTADLAGLAQRVSEGANAHEVATSWLAEHGL